MNTRRRARDDDVLIGNARDAATEPRADDDVERIEDRGRDRERDPGRDAPGWRGTACGAESAGAIVSTVPASASASAASLTARQLLVEEHRREQRDQRRMQVQEQCDEPAGASVSAVKNENAWPP